MVHPFDTFLNRKELSVQGDLLSSCVNLLGEQISSYREQLSRTTRLSFHIGDPLDLCYKNRYWAGQFHVVDCSSLPDQMRLANILNAAGIPLSMDDPQVYITNYLKSTLLFKITMPTTG